MKDPLVSVIVPNYNYARYLPERLDSIFNQTFQDFEVIILDDCSTDSSREVIERYRNHPKVSHVVLNEVNTGSPFVQWESGLKLARGRYVWIAEADDLAELTFLEKTVAAAERDPEIAAVKTMSRLIDSDGAPSPHKPFEDFKPDGKCYLYDGTSYLDKRLIWWNHCYNASMMLFRKEVWQSFASKPYMKLRYVGDWLFWGMVINRHKIAEIREYLSCFRLHGKSVTDGAKRSARLCAEGDIVAHLFRDMLPGTPTGLKIYNRYHLYKSFRKKGVAELRKEIETIYPDFWKELGISSREYPWLWLYKHTIWLLEKRYLKRQSESRKSEKALKSEILWDSQQDNKNVSDVCP